MSKLIITADKKTFAVYDLKTLKQTFVKPVLKKLLSPHLKYTGSPTFRDFGIEYDKKHIYIATHDKIAIFDRMTYKYLSLLPIKAFVNTHQILKVKDTFYIANSANDSIGIFDLKNKVSKYLDIKKMQVVPQVQEPLNAKDLDVYHVNSLCYHQDKIYFCLNNRGEKPSGYYIYDPATEKTKHFASAGLYGHGIVIHEGYLYTLSTGTYELIQIDLKTKKKAAYVVAEDGIFLRGLVEHRGRLLFGNSCNYNNPKKIRAFIAEFDLQTKQHKRLIPLDKEGIIYDLKVLH